MRFNSLVDRFKLYKMNNIHSTAIIEDGVALGINNTVGPYSVLKKGCKIGDGNYIGPQCYIDTNTVVGDSNRFEGYCSVGTPPEHRDYFTKNGKTTIGNNNVVRELVTIHSGSTSETTLGNNIIILNHSHVAHDCKIEDNVNISAGVIIAGHVYVMEGANLALSCAVHQRTIIGAYCIVGMNSTVTLKSKVLPFHVCVGSPCKPIKKYEKTLSRYNVSSKHAKVLQNRYNNFINEKNS